MTKDQQSQPQSKDDKEIIMTDSDMELVEKNFLEKFYKLAKEENDLEKKGKKNQKLSAEVDKLQDALIRIRGAKKN